MRKFQTTFFVIGMLIFLTQSVRHIHLLFYGQEKSILSQFDDDANTNTDIENSKSMDELLQLYRTSKEHVVILEKEKSDDELKIIRSENETLFSKYHKSYQEIQEREKKGRETRDLWIFCGSGILYAIFGGYLYLINTNWLSMSIILAGFAEIIWWSSPSFNFSGASAEYRFLLINKIIISCLGAILLILFWNVNQKIINSEK